MLFEPSSLLALVSVGFSKKLAGRSWSLSSKSEEKGSATIRHNCYSAVKFRGVRGEMEHGDRFLAGEFAADRGKEKRGSEKQDRA